MFAPIWAALTQFLMYAMPRIAAFFGIYILADTVTKPMFVWIQQQVMSQLASASQFQQAFALLGVNDFVSIVFNAYLLALSLKAGKAAAK